MTKKIFREIWSKKFRSFSIILVVAITLAMLTGLRASYPMMLETYDLNRDVYNVADGRFSFSQPIHQDNLTNLKENSEFLTQSNIDRIDGRIIFRTDLTYNDEKFPAVVIGINYPNDVNELVIEHKSPNITNNNQLLESNRSCFIETHFAGQSIPIFGQDVHVDDELSINFDGNQLDFNVEAIVQDSDYIYLVDDVTNMPLLGALAIVWINIETIQEIKFDGIPLINQILFTVEERFNEDQILSAADNFYDYYINNNIDINSLKFEIYSENPEYLMFEGDAGAVDKVGTIFGILGIIICSVIILNTLSKLVNSQRKNIGLFLAMGAKKWKILFHYVGITLFLAIIGVLVGLPLGYWFSIELAKLTTKLYILHQFSYTVPIGEFIIGSIITLGICSIFSLLSAWGITSITPREAMTATFTRIKKTGKSVAEKLLGWIPLFKPIYMTVPLREVFMKKKKTLISIFALTTSMIFLVNSVALEYNMYAAMMNNFNVYHTYDVQVELETPVPVQMIENFMKNDSIEPLEDITHSEIFIDVFTKISLEDEFLGWAQLFCYQENSTLRSYNVIEGDNTEKSDLNSQEILLGNSIAGKYNISLGDKIDIGILGNLSVEISGLVGELIDYSVLWTYESFQESNISSYFGMPKGFVNGIVFTVKDDTDLTELRQVFEENFKINTWVESEVALHSTMVLMESLMGLMSIFLIIGIVIGILFSFQSMYMAFVDRGTDFLAFKAMGTEMKYIRRMIFWENVILSFFGLLLTVPFGYLSYWWTLDYMLEDKFYIPKEIPWFSWPFVLLLSLFSIWLATGRLTKKIKNINLADELRQTGTT